MKESSKEEPNSAKGNQTIPNHCSVALGINKLVMTAIPLGCYLVQHAHPPTIAIIDFAEGSEVTLFSVYVLYSTHDAR